MSNLSRSTEFAKALAKARLIEEAVEKLYARRGGDALDGRIAMYDAAVEIARHCRQAELVRCKAGEVLRAKGERPMVSVTEARLYCDRAIKLSREREAVKASIREQIANSIAAANASSEEEIRAAIELVTSAKATEADAKVASSQAEQCAATEKEVGPRVALVSQVEYIEDRKALAKALAEKDEAEIARVVKLQPAKWQRKWAEAG